MFDPQQLRFSKDHEWISSDGTIGISDFAQKELGDVVFVELPKISKEVEKGKELAVLESVKSVSSVYSPVDGVIKEVNNDLIQSPELVNQDPYGRGWIVKIELKDKSQLDELMTFTEYENFVKNKS